MLDALRGLLPAIAASEAHDPESFPAASVAAMGEAGLLLGPFPRSAGGEGATLEEAVRAIELLAAASPSLALLTAMPLGLAGIFGCGPDAAPPEHRAAWTNQVDRAAAAYRRGEIYAACNSEKGAGGSLAATTTVARRDSTGAFRLTGEKILASFGKHADHFFSTAKVDHADLPGGGAVEFFLVSTRAPGVEILADWDGFGMRSTESQTVRYSDAPAEELLGFPNFIEVVKPLQYFFCLFAAVPLGCAASILRALADPPPASPALRLRLAEATMRYESLRAYLLETARGWRPGASPAYAARVLRTKTFVTQESTRLCADLFALGGGRHYRRTSPVARALAGAFAGTALRPPLVLGLDSLIETFSPGWLSDAEPEPAPPLLEPRPA
jgi:alkylation response protein AidB-like acyl-CoA dehydrogenase